MTTALCSVFLSIPPTPATKIGRLIPAVFFAVIHDNWKGVVTSEASLTRALSRYAGARTFSAFTWSRFLDLWTLDCPEYHEHEYETPEVRARAALKVRQHLRSVAHYEQLVAADEAIREEEERAEEEGEAGGGGGEAGGGGGEAGGGGVKGGGGEAGRGGGEAGKEGGDGVPGGDQATPGSSESPTRAAAVRPRAGAGRRITAAFNCEDVRQTYLRQRSASLTVTTPQAPPITPPQTPARIAVFDDHTHVPTTRLSGLPPYTSVQELETRPAQALYAVHANGRNRVFNNQCLAENVLRARAVEVLKDTPGGELVFVGDEQNLWRFLDDQ
ncbi:hypothetical protein B0H14DRAFT_2604542 [Mycena olivaceomarginata]|nr:hypothetical protein B0H14DRAFT_2604542 [Mycena olivaceomarginata]